MKVGLEVHQQLATGKLFCECPVALTEEVDRSFVRRLRAARGEDQLVDPAAAFEAARALMYRYESGPSDCLVEGDEEPPHRLNPEAMDVALTLALLLKAHTIEEVEVMRKIVIDGSNPSGFQRTALVAVDGEIEVDGAMISISSICLEEDAARKVRESSAEVTYRLDRLGIPLIEIATGPDITNGAQARNVAEAIGGLLRSTRKVRRGIGSIREDLNVSVEGGARVEIKGVQELRLIPHYVDGEVARQEQLLEIKQELDRRKAPTPDADPDDVTAFFHEEGRGFLRHTARTGGFVLALRLKGFGRLLGSPAARSERLGRELADHARTAGVRGLIHSDELPGYEIDEEFVARLKKELSLESDDAFVVIADRERSRAVDALRRVAARAQAAQEGVPPETRDPLPDGRTQYSRPLPGRERMYPETDVPPVPVDSPRLHRLRENLPESPPAELARLEKTTGLARELLHHLQAWGEVDRFVALMDSGHAPATVARLLVNEIPALEVVNGPPREFTLEELAQLLDSLDRAEFAKEGLPLVLAEMARGSTSVKVAIERAGFALMSREELDALVDRILKENADLLRKRGKGAFSALMGDVMREVRGRRDGKEVADALRSKLNEAARESS